MYDFSRLTKHGQPKYRTTWLLLNEPLNQGVVYLAFLALSPLANDCLMMSQCMHFTFGDKREVYLLNESPVTEKESMREGKRSISPKMEYVHANLNANLNSNNLSSGDYKIFYNAFI